MNQPTFDLVGVGLNATDTLIKVAHFPAYGGKVPIEAEILSPGGQVASALTAAATLGMRVKYIGTVGDDERGRIQLASLRATGINSTTLKCARIVRIRWPTSSSMNPPGSAPSSGVGLIV
jgi:sulfofructose kinase